MTPAELREQILGPELAAKAKEMDAAFAVALINALDPDVRKDVVYAMVATHVKAAQADGELHRMLGEILWANGVGLFVISSDGITSWRSTYQTTHPQAELLLELITSLDGLIERKLDTFMSALGGIKLEGTGVPKGSA